MKKIISGILFLTLLLGFCGIFAVTAAPTQGTAGRHVAMEEPTQGTAGRHVATEETPEEILAYAKDEFPRISLPVCDL